MNKQKSIGQQRQRRRFRVRNRIRGTSDRPRLCVYRSLTNIACQIIDDTSHRTVAAASSREKQLRENVRRGGNKDAAKVVGKAIAERAQQAGIQQVRFDRGHYKYHGRVAALADAAREAGLIF